MATKQILMSGSRDNPSESAPEYQSLLGNSLPLWTATEVNGEELISTPGTLSNFQVGVTTAPGAGKSWVFTVRKAASGAAMADTALSVTISDSNVLSSLDSDTVTVAAGDRVTVSATPSGTPTAAAAVHWSCEFIPDTDGETVLLSNTAGTNIAANQFHTLIGGKATDATEFDGQTLFPAPGTLKKFYVETTGVAGAGNSAIFTIQKNGTPSSIVVTISGASEVADNDTANTLTVAAGDKVTIVVTYSGTPTSGKAKFGITFLPDTQGQFIASATTDDVTSSTAVEYQHLNTGGATLVGTETEMHSLASVACTAKAIYVNLATAPAASNTWTFTLRRNAATTTALTISIVGTATSGNYAEDIAISAADLLDTAIDAMAGTATSTSQIAYLFYIAPTGGGTTYALDCSDGLTAGESIVARGVFGMPITDGLKGGESIGPKAIMGMSIADGLLGGESLLPIYKFPMSLLDGMKGGESLSTQGVFGITVSDGLKGSESLGTRANLNTLITDGLNMGDSPTFEAILQMLISDGTKLGEVLILGLLYQMSLSEGFKVGDSPILQSVLTMSLSDGLKVGDSPSFQNILQMLLSDGVTFAEAVSLLKLTRMEPPRRNRVTRAHRVLSSRRFGGR